MNSHSFVRAWQEGSPWDNKKLSPHKGREPYAPCYHLCLRTAHAIRLIKHSANARCSSTITSAGSVAAYFWFGARLRDVFIRRSLCPSHLPGTLCKAPCGLLLLFLAFDKCYEWSHYTRYQMACQRFFTVKFPVHRTTFIFHPRYETESWSSSHTTAPTCVQ